MNKYIEEYLSILKVENLNVSSGDKKILSNVDIKIFNKEITVIVGPTGSGKSTLAKIFAGIWTEFEGLVSYDQKNINFFSANDLKENIGYLPQSVLLYSGTVSENIASMGIPNAHRVIEVSKLVGMHEFVLRLPQGYDTLLGPGTVSLSGGERQRIGLARAVYNNPKILILDEPNSSLDQFGEANLAKALKFFRDKERIIIVISHRKSIFAVADKVIELRDGKITFVKPVQEYREMFVKDKNKLSEKK